MQYKIPQNVGIEDKIVGPLSLRQLIIVAVGVGVSWVLFAIMSKVYELNFIEYAVIAMPALFSAAFALIRINDQSLTKYLQLLMEFSMKPKRRLWDHRGIAYLVDPDLGEPVVAESTKLNAAMLAKSQKATNLRQLSLVLDSGGFEHVKAPLHKDIDIAQDENLVTQAYFGNEDKEKMNMYWRTVESHKKRLDFFAKLPTTQLRVGTQEAELVRQEIAKAKEAGEAARRQAMATPPRPKPSAPVSRPPQPAPRVETPKPPQASKPVAPPPMAQAQAPKPIEKPQPPQPPVAAKAQASPTQAPKPSTPPSAGNKPPMPKPAPTANVGGQGTQPPKKQAPQPVRQGHVNTTKPNAPAQYIPKAPPTPQAPKVQRESQVSSAENKSTPQPTPTEKPTEPGAKGGEFKFEELKKGEIEINLD